MKKIFLILSVLFLLSCDGMVTNNDSNKNYNIIIIDECEYIEVDYGLGELRVYSLTHKGNCSNPIHYKN